MNNSADKDSIMARLGNLKNAEPIYKSLSVRDDYTIEERELIKEWLMKADNKNKENNTQAWKVRGTPRKRPSLGENHQANVNKNIKNDRDNTNAQLSPQQIMMEETLRRGTNSMWIIPKEEHVNVNIVERSLVNLLSIRRNIFYSIIT